MKTMLKVAVVLGGLGMTMGANAADLGAKFGYVDFQRALNEVEEGKRARASLKSEFEQKQRALETIQGELQRMQADLDKQRLILSADALKDREEAYRKKVLELTEKMNTYKMELQGKEARVTGGILNAMHGIVQEIGKKNGYTMILEKSQEVVLYSPQDSDLTSQVIQEFNALPKAKKDAAMRNGDGAPTKPTE